MNGGPQRAPKNIFLETYTCLPIPTSKVHPILTPFFPTVLLHFHLLAFTYGLPGLRLPGQSYQVTGATNIITPSHFSVLPLLLIVILLLIVLHLLLLPHIVLHLLLIVLLLPLIVWPPSPPIFLLRMISTLQK